MYKNYIVADAHCDLGIDVYMRREAGETRVLDNHHYQRLNEAGVKVQTAAIYVEARHKPARAVEMGIKQLISLREDLNESEHFKLILTRQDLDDVLQCDKIGILLTIEGAEVIEPGLEFLRLYYMMGVRMLGLVWQNRNALADGNGEEIYGGGGLSQYGREVVAECDRLGIMIDLSHLSKAGVDDVLRFSSGNILVSHASSRTLRNIPRNVEDYQIKAVGERGGMFGLAAYPSILSENTPDDPFRGG